MRRWYWLAVATALAVLLSCDSDAPSGNDAAAVDGEDDVDAPDVVTTDLSDIDAGDAGDAADEMVALDLQDSVEDADAPLDPDRVTPRFDPLSEGFYRMPWPSDWRLFPNGHPDLSDFPERYAPVVDIYLTGIEAEVVGFATIPVVYVGFDGALDAGAMPSPADTLLASSPVRLVAVDPARCGETVPIVVAFHPMGDPFRDDNVLTAVPVPGFVLEPSTAYALLVDRDIPAGDDRHVATPDAFRAALDGTSSVDGLSAVYAPLLDCADDAGIDLDELAVATVFTTQDPVGELREIVDLVLDPSAVADPTITELGYVSGMGTSAVRGTYETPIFQRGEPPYGVEGGGFRFEDDGTPILQRWESVDFVVWMPNGPGAPFPVVLWEDGTGAEVADFLHDGEWLPAARNNGFAIASFEQPFVGSRAVPGGLPGMTSSIVNPEGARTSPRQQVVDTAYFLRVLQALPEANDDIDIDPDRVVYGGQSQGANIGAMAAGVVPDIEAYALNGVGGYLAYSILDREDDPSIASLVAAALRISESDLSIVHPMLAAVQMGGEAADPINYAATWRGWTDYQAGSHVLLINGYLDPYVPPSCSGALVVAGDATPLAPPGWEVDPCGVWYMVPSSPPVSGNTRSVGGRALTIVSLQSADTGHFTVYDRSEVAEATGRFWAGALDGAPVVTLE